MTVEVRRVAADELETVGALTLRAYRDDGFVAVGSAYVHELADAARRDAEAEVWVAVEDGAVLGSVTFAEAGTPFAELAEPGEAEFRMLAVAREARRRGVAEALVDRCAQRARETGCSWLVMSSMVQMTDAHRLYQRMGFARDPDRDWSPVPGVQLRAFRLPVGPPAA